MTTNLMSNLSGKLQQDGEWLKTLEENLENSRHLKTSILNLLESFEQRLKHLDDTVIPLHEKAESIHRKQANIKKILKTVDAMQQFYGRAAELESSIREGSVALEREKYIERMEQLAEAISFFSSHPTYQDQLENMKLTFESGCCALEKEFRNVLQADSIVSNANLVDCLDQDFEVITTNLSKISTMRDYTRVSQIAKWLLNHNASASLVEIYVNVRGDNILRALTFIYQLDLPANTQRLPMNVPKISITPKTSTVSLKQAIRKATGRTSERFDIIRECCITDKAVESILISLGSFIALIQLESDVMKKVIDDVSVEAKIQRYIFVSSLRSIFERSIRLLDELDCTLVPMLPLLKYITAHHNQLLFLSSNSYGEVPYDAFYTKAYKKSSDLLDDFFDRLSKDSNKYVPEDGNVHQVTSNTLNFLSNLMEYRSTVTQLVSSTASTASPSYHLRRLFARILSALRINLKEKSENYNDETLAAIFLLNNNNYIHNALQNDAMFAVASELDSQVRSFYRSEVELYKSKYLQSWTRVISTIPSEFSTNEDKHSIKSSLITFNAEFEKVMAMQKNYCIADVGLSRDIRSDVKKLVCEKFTEFHIRFLRSPVTKGFEKYVKYTPESLEMIIDRLFDSTA